MKFTLSRFRFTILLLLLLNPFLLSAQEQQCSATEDGSTTNNGQCNTNNNNNPNTKQEFQVQVINHSTYRGDLYWDDGQYGQQVAILEANGGKTQINTFEGHSFFVTRHGVKEGLFDIHQDVPIRFTIKSQNMQQQVLEIPKDAAPSNNPCQDRFSICEQEALRGSCWSSPGWMIVHCCKSCDQDLNASKLIDPNVRCTKERLNITEPAWKPGDLNALFESWMTDPLYQKFQPQVWSSPHSDTFGGIDGPWVITFDNFFNEYEAEALIKGGEMVGFERSTDQGKLNHLGEREKVVSQTRTSSNAWCIGSCERMKEVRALTRRIEQVTNVPKRNYESFQILEYEHNQFYRQHHDSSGNDKSISGHRILTFFLYLSDVEEGGETKFNKLGIQVQPKRGRALIWPSVKNEDPTQWDPRTFHEAMPVIKGKKYAANHWIHLNDYEGPNRWGCTGSFS